MASIIKVDTIKDTGSNDIITSDGAGNVTVNTSLNFGDNDKAQFGASNDLQIFHDTTDSWIQDRGTGNLKLGSNGVGVEIRRKTDSADESMAVFNNNGSVDLYYDNSKKFETTSTGIDVTGTVAGDTLKVNDATDASIELGLNGKDDLFSGTNRCHIFAGRGSTGDFLAGSLNLQSRDTAQDRPIQFITGQTPAIRMVVDGTGNVLVGKTSTSSSVQGLQLNGTEGFCTFTRNSNPALLINRQSNDGDLVRFYQADALEGSISVSGSTVSYNGFTGTHWSRLSNNSKPTILKGTILESLDEMMDWYQVQFDITDDERGNTTTHKESYALGDGESVGDVITYNYNTEKQDDEGNDIIEEVQATIIQEGDVKHTKSKISDTVDAKNVYGVFVDWDNDDDTVNDMYVAQTGTFVVRMNSAETVFKGDLIQSNGDGTGKVQADDIIRASTVAKVLSITKIETYEDGSYIVPCSLHC